MEAQKEVVKEKVRNGVSKSLYISKQANALLRACGRATRRSQSEIVSMLAEKYGQQIVRDPRLLSM
jgi:hypothetical protein